MPRNLPMSEVATFLADMPQTERSDGLLLLYSELHTVRLLVNAEEPAVFLGGFSAAPPGEDVGQREETLEAIAAAAENIEHQAFGHAESAGAPDFVSANPMKWQSVEELEKVKDIERRDTRGAREATATDGAP